MLLGERAGARRRGENLLEAGAIFGAGRMRSRSVEDFGRDRAHAGHARIRVLANRSQALREHGKDLRRIVAPRRRFEVEVLLSDVALHTEEGIERAREFDAAFETSELDDRTLAFAQCRRDRGPAARAFRQFV